MLEVLICKDANTVAALYQKHLQPVTPESRLIRAMLGEECLGYCLFSIVGEKALVHTVVPAEDFMLADGLLRSALHVACQQGVAEAFYTDPLFEPLYEKIGFIQDKTEHRLKLNNLYSGCCHCNGPEESKA